MPEDERSPATPDLSGPHARSDEQWIALLEAGEVELEGRMPWSSNATFLVTVRLPDGEGRAIYKPGDGERPLWDFPDGLYRREVAAYELSHALGFDVVPETVLRAQAPYGAGSLQRFIDADFEQHYFLIAEHARHEAALRLLAGFDLLANNADRKGGHVLIDSDEHIWGIDNGLCFHPAPKLRTVMWDYAGERLPDAVLAASETLLRAVPERLQPLLADDEIEGLEIRAETLIATGIFPEPDLDDRPYPWPLV